MPILLQRKGLTPAPKRIRVVTDRLNALKHAGGAKQGASLSGREGRLCQKLAHQQEYLIITRTLIRYLTASKRR